MRTLTPRQVSCPTEVSPLHVTRPLRPFCIQSPYAPPSPLSHATPQLDGSPLRVQTSPVACRLVGVTRPNRFRLLRTGLSPPVALHLALGDAVTFGYRPESVCLKRTFTSLNVCAHGRTSLGFQPQDRGPIQSSAPKGRRHGRVREPRCGWMECLRPFRAPGNWRRQPGAEAPGFYVGPRCQAFRVSGSAFRLLPECRLRFVARSSPGSKVLFLLPQMRSRLGLADCARNRSPRQASIRADLPQFLGEGTKCSMRCERLGQANGAAPSLMAARNRTQPGAGHAPPSLKSPILRSHFLPLDPYLAFSSAPSGMIPWSK